VFTQGSFLPPPPTRIFMYVDIMHLLLIFKYRT